ncbi:MULTISPECIES: DUF302 domain-containing protein [Pontibacillus]|uniref:DUF302 domain-containing protein n=1 Tax=Pontibacillus chungwhensis TaxID=265426 RepID=A0ABY8UYH2_9BACI|nr:MULTISPECIES: DUF302 domain-containing protein [Pontibacillus]MCD5325203.1 DUF302 domain-containing protein [Pontibacillus sp. HN14]WIF97450.1 DUF302 domain-containing protein [Pontibacillus chungwhensis]
MFHYTVETSKSLDEAVDALQTQLKEEKFGVLWDFNVKDTLQSKGFDFNTTYRILEVCNPGEAKNILEKNALASYFLPCKVVVYEQDGSTKMGMPKPTSLIGFLEDEELNDQAKDIEERMAACMDKAAQ